MTNFYLPPEVSRKQVNRAGKILLSGKPASSEYQDALAVANQWRLAHLYPINTFQARLRTMTKNIPTAIVAQRLKRMPTIIDKLDRHPNMQLSTMQDIGGVRAIVRTVNEVRHLVQGYENSKRFSHILKDKKDYVTTPKTDGYRGIHLIYKYNNTLARTPVAKACQGLLLEVQIRTQEQHIWSTAVETMSIMLKQPLKTRGGDKDWEDFFALMSSAIAIVEDQNVLPQHEHLQPIDIYKRIAKRAKQLRALDLMTGYLFATKLVQDKYHGYYNIITLDISDRTVRVDAYAKSEFKKASQEYAKLEQETRDDHTKDIVLVSAGEIKTLRKAYPNYFLDIDSFVQRLHTIIEAVDELG